MKITARKISSSIALAVALGCILLSGGHASAGDSGKMASKYQINIQDFSFQPATLNVPVGATVTWTNKDEEPHTVFSSEDVFKSKALDTDETFSFTFAKAGTYKYFCSVHPKMVATIVVEDKKHSTMKMDKKVDPMKMDGKEMDKRD